MTEAAATLCDCTPHSPHTGSGTRPRVALKASLTGSGQGIGRSMIALRLAGDRYDTGLNDIHIDKDRFQVLRKEIT